MILFLFTDKNITTEVLFTGVAFLYIINGLHVEVLSYTNGKKEEFS